MKKLILPIAIVLILGLFFALPLLIKVKTACLSQYGACSPELEALIKANEGKSIRAAQAGINKNLKNYPSVSDFSSHFKLPNTLLTDVIIKKPAFAVTDIDSGKTWLLSEAGEALVSSEGSLLPTVTTRINLVNYQKVDDKTLFALKLMKGMYDMYQVQKGEITQNGLAVELPPRFTVTFPLEGDAQVLLGEIRLVYSKLQSEENLLNYSQIDLRFKNPVLR